MKRFLFALIGLFQAASATEYLPWYGKALQLEGRLTQVFQQYNSLKIKDHSYRANGINAFTDFSLMVPFDVYCAEFEVVAVDTHRRELCVDCIRLTGRYMWLDEDLGDAFNLTTGITATQTFGKAAVDVATYHPGKIAGELHTALGKTWDLCEGWEVRGWGVAGLGTADNGPAWTFGTAAVEFRSLSGNFFRIYSDIHYAFGGDRFHHWDEVTRAKRHFLDVGVRYTHRFDDFFELSLEYAYRTWVKNGYGNSNLYLLQFMYPFSI